MLQVGVIIAAVIAALYLSPAADARGGGRSGGYSGIGSNPSTHYNRGYTTRNGTYVAPHYQTNPNSTMRDNYNTRGNYNPHNGQTGSRLVPY